MSPVDNFPTADPIPASVLPGPIIPAVPPPPVFQKPSPAPAASPPPRRRHLFHFLLPGLVTLTVLVGLGLASWQVGKRQSFFASAWDCQLYSYQVAPDGTVTAANHSSRRPSQKAQVTINNSPVTIFSVPPLDQGQTTTIGKIIPPLGGIISWQVIGTAGCSSTGSYTPTPAVSHPQTPVLLIPTLIPDKPTPTF